MLFNIYFFLFWFTHTLLCPGKWCPFGNISTKPSLWLVPSLFGKSVCDYAQVDNHWGFANGIEAQCQYNLWFAADDELTDCLQSLFQETNRSVPA